MTLQDFMAIVMRSFTMPGNENQRLGQLVFNRAYAQPELRDKVNELRGGLSDPFYDDDKIDAFLVALFGPAD